MTWMSTNYPEEKMHILILFNRFPLIDLFFQLEGDEPNIRPRASLILYMNRSILSELDPVSNGFDTHEVKTTNVNGKGPGFLYPGIVTAAQ